MQVILDHYYYYERFLNRTWDNMTPMQYGSLLVSIAAVGWILMKSQRR
jgi:hypothetical protein